MPVCTRVSGLSWPDGAHWIFALEAAQNGEPVRVLGTLKREFHTSLARGPPPMITVPVELIWLAVTFTMVMAGFLAAASE